MKKYFLCLILFQAFLLIQLSAQSLSMVGAQWSSSRLSYNIPFEGFNMGSEASAFGFLRWGNYLLLVPEIGIRQQNQSFATQAADLTRFRIRSIHVKLSALFPFSKKFHQRRQGWFASLAFSQNLGFHFQEIQLRGGLPISRIDALGSSHEGDIHIGLGYTRPLSNKLNLLIRAEYAEGSFPGAFWSFRRNELSLGVGLGWSWGAVLVKDQK